MLTGISDQDRIDLGTFPLKGHDLILNYAPGELFIPNATTRLFSKCVRIDSGDTVFDLGSGVGPLAIWAAMESSRHVYAVEAVARQCDLIRVNAGLNNVADKVTAYCGNLFDPIADGLLADVIIGDLSGIAEIPARVLGWYPPDVPTGGPDGTIAIASLLRQAVTRLKPGGRLYFPVAIGLSDDAKIMQTARESFRNLTKVVDVNFPLTPEQLDAVTEAGRDLPFLKFTRRGSKHVWHGEIYEASDPIR